MDALDGTTPDSQGLAGKADEWDRIARELLAPSRQDVNTSQGKLKDWTGSGPDVIRTSVHGLDYAHPPAIAACGEMALTLRSLLEASQASADLVRMAQPNSVVDHVFSTTYSVPCGTTDLGARPCSG